MQTMKLTTTLMAVIQCEGDIQAHFNRHQN